MKGDKGRRRLFYCFRIHVPHLLYINTLTFKFNRDDLNRRCVDYLIMILSIPYQAFEVGNIHITPFQMDRFGKTIARLSYKDHSIDFQDVSILSPPLTVLDYHPETSRLRLDLSDHHMFQVKMNTLHEYLISTIYVHQQSFLNQKNRSYDFVKRLFYFLLDGSVLSLFIYPAVQVKKQNGAHCTISDLKKGDVIRCVIRLQGISQILNNGELRMRLHHSVPSTWLISSQ